uniref:Alpha-1,3/1,6-mannosyltransferase ALG2 n=1 Tax=Romanomermis culicivorax TaxID=13658 RepID=A0A915IN17_ROMCU
MNFVILLRMSNRRIQGLPIPLIKKKSHLNVIFLHPDLGIGGAERLVVDAALSLKFNGHDVRFLTSHHDKNHCFKETRDGTLNVWVQGAWIPRHFCSFFHAFFAYIRSLYTVVFLLFYSKWKFDLIFADQISAPLFLLKKFSRAKIIFYCHFPDQLLVQKTGFLRSLYRKPLNLFEEYTTGLADCVVVNSNFTAETFRKTFKSLDNIYLEVLHPCVSSALLKWTDRNEINGEKLKNISSNLKPNYFLSLNRFERKKNIALAIRAIGLLKNQLCNEDFDNIHLVIAGGYDSVNKENIVHFDELKMLVEKLNLESYVTFFKSPSDDQKACLLMNCFSLIYTPSFEHFGIVPVEAMLCRKPVIAVNNGGLLETVVNNQTGVLVDAEPEHFARAMKRLLLEPNLVSKFGEAGRNRALRHFTTDIFAEKLNALCIGVCCGATRG